MKTENLKNKDTLYINTGVKEEQAKLPPPRYAFSLSGGFSKMDVKVSGVENNNKMHKDTRMIFEQSNQNLKTTFINFGFDLLVFPRINIGLNTGIQYVKVETPVNINYQLTEIPWRDQEGNITHYIDRPPIDLSSNSTNYTTYINVPLRINFSLPLNPTNEILLTAGANLSTLAAVKGGKCSNKYRKK